MPIIGRLVQEDNIGRCLATVYIALRYQTESHRHVSHVVNNETSTLWRVHRLKLAAVQARRASPRARHVKPRWFRYMHDISKDGFTHTLCRTYYVR